MSIVSQTAIFSNYSLVPLGSKVNIIPKEFVRFDYETYKDFSIDDTKFLNGTLISRQEVPSENEGRGGIVQYVVKLDNSDTEITFPNSPPTYYFKVNTQYATEHSSSELAATTATPGDSFVKRFTHLFTKKEMPSDTKPSIGGKKSRRKRNIKKSRKNRRKSTRRH
jgi:hypothetical protein